jgi:pyruvate-ferredoxin/flavodoxin oxidoreductase
MASGLDRQKKAVAAGYWPLYRYDPRRAVRGQAPLELDSGAPSIPLAEYMAGESRFRITAEANPARYAELVALAERRVASRFEELKRLASTGE